MCEDEIIKLKRVRDYLTDKSFTGMILTRQDTFNWITTGGNSRVIVPRDMGFAVVVITPEQVYLTSQVMDGSRIMDEEMENLHAEYVPLRWYEKSPLEKSLELAGSNPCCDVPVNGSECRLNEIYDLQFPLTKSEITKMEELGQISDEVYIKAANQITIGMSDYEAEAILLYEFAKHNVQCDVLLIGTDERIFNYRHPSPVGAKLGRYVLLHVAARKGGLHCNVTRSVYFGDKLPERINVAYNAVSEIEAHCLSRCIEGVSWSDILKEEKELFRQFGFDEEWRNHYPGGRTGYFVCQADLSLSDKKIKNGEAFDWFITVTGAKVEELSVSVDGNVRVLSNTGLWPSKRFSSQGMDFSLPLIMMR